MIAHKERIESWKEIFRIEIEPEFEPMLTQNYPLLAFYGRIDMPFPGKITSVYYLYPVFVIVAAKRWVGRKFISLARFLKRHGMLRHKEGELLPWHWIFTRIKL